ncbi:hypothetical protein EMCRGX_G020246 [Ephydatia muelleri]|eukprot:Em0016g180a
MLPLLLVALYTMRKEQHGPIPTTRANVELHQDAVTPLQESSSQLRYSEQDYEADDHCRLNQCLKVFHCTTELMGNGPTTVQECETWVQRPIQEQGTHQPSRCSLSC